MSYYDGGIAYSKLLEKVSKLSYEESSALRNRLPSVFWKPNRAQRRPAHVWNRERYPFIHVITFGNGTGKTEFLGQFLAGCCLGNKFVTPGLFQSKYFDDLSELRDTGELVIWWVCDSTLMTEQGPDYKAIRRHIPGAKFKGKQNNSGHYTRIEVPWVDASGRSVNIIVQVKTHGQDVLAFAGPNVHVIICDEPPEQLHWAEMIGRTRSKSGEVGSRIIIGATITKESGGDYLYDLVQDETLRDVLEHSEGSLWENCVGTELPDEQALRLGIPKLENGVYDTDGVLTRESIENQIRFWEKSYDPSEVIARVDGKFTQVMGKIYKTLNKDVHFVVPYKIPEKYPVIQVVDPHDTRDDISTWGFYTPRNRIVWFAECPDGDYEKLSGRSATIPLTCDRWREIEAKFGVSNRVAIRIGDPNAMLDPDPNTGKTKLTLYRENGFDFFVYVSDKVEYGHECVRQFIYFEPDKYFAYPDEPMYQPRMVWFNNMRNSMLYMARYGTKQNRNPSKAVSEVVDPKWKEYCDNFRYAAVWLKDKSYDDLVARLNPYGGDWRKIKEARKPYRIDESMYKGFPVMAR